jgi:diguanylate cyclase (GGDEF)-like protein
LVELNRAGLALFEARDIAETRAYGLLNFVLPQYHDPLRDAVGRTVRGEQCRLEFEITGLRGTRRWMEARTAPLGVPGNAATRALVVTRDVTERKLAEARIDHLSHHDALTALPNRSLFQDRLERAVSHARRRGEFLGVLMVNLDRFSKVNEALGASTGDAVLVAVGRRMQALLRNVDTIARINGNEFAVLVEGMASADEGNLVAEKLSQSFEAAFHVNGQEVFLSASMGVAVFPNGTRDPCTLLQHAETAMREIKRDGGNGYALFEEREVQGNGQSLDLERGLRHALERGELELHYQPKVSVVSRAVIGAEALVRWRHPELGLVSPAHFIPIAEETGLILPIGEWVLRTACRNASAWRAEGLNLDVAVNLSPRQFRHRDLPGIVADALEASGLDPERLELEITETAALSQPERAEHVLRTLRGLGVRIALDDFGTGHSSLSHLRKLPLDAVKVDRSFVRDIATNAQDRAIVLGVTTLGHTLGMRITAEGVEDGVQLEAIRLCGCDEYQGYHFSLPLPAAEFRALLENITPAEPNHAGKGLPADENRRYEAAEAMPSQATLPRQAVAGQP